MQLQDLLAKMYSVRHRYTLHVIHYENTQGTRAQYVVYDGIII